MSRCIWLILLITSSARAEVVELPPAEVEVLGSDDAAPPESALGTGTANVVEPEDIVGTPQTLADLMAEVPGVQLRRAGTLGALTTLSLRGTGSENVAFVLDDVVLGSATLGAVDLSLVPAQDLERVEIYRGTGPVRFVNPLGGVVVLTSRVPSDKLTLRGHMGYGAFNTMSLGGVVGGPVGPVRSRLALAYDGTGGDYVFYDNRYTETNVADDRLRRRTNNHFRQGAAKLSLEMDGPKDGTWRMDASGKLSTQGVSGTRLTAAKDTRAEQRELLGRIALNDGKALDERLRFFAGISAVASERRFLDPNNEAGLQVGSTTSRLVQIAADGRLMWLATLSHETELAPRVSVERFTQAGTVNRAGQRGTELGRLSGMLAAEHRADITEWLRVVPSVRVEGTRDDGPEARNELQASPRLGAIGFFEPCELRANVGRHHRFPTVLERYGDNATISTSLDLSAETGWATDTSLSCKGKPALLEALGASLDASVGAFYVDAKNLIVLVKNSVFFLNAENLGAATSQGLEARLQGSARYGALAASYTLTDTHNREPGIGAGKKRIPGEPMHRVIAALGLGPTGARLTYEILFASQSYLDTPNNQLVPTRFLQNLLGELALPWQDLALKGTVQNVANVRAVNVPQLDATGGVGVAPLLDYVGYPLPGRSFFVSLLWRPE